MVQNHCIAHRLNIAVTDTITKDDNYYKSLKTSSVGHTTTLKTVQNLLDEPGLMIKEQHSIKWLGLKMAVETFSGVKYLLCLGEVSVAFMLDVHEVNGVLNVQLQKQSIVLVKYSL